MKLNNDKIRIEKRYLNSWCYNRSRVLEEIAKIVKKNGGLICGTYEQFCKVEAINRSLEEKKKELKENIDHLVSLGKDLSDTEWTKELKELEEIDNTPITFNFTGYIGFALNGYYYYLDMNDNPFFDFYYDKIPIDKNLSYTGIYYSTIFIKENWWDDKLYSFKIPEEEIKNIATKIYISLINDYDRSSLYKEQGKATLVKWDI